jgi:hypothetical protein
MIRPDIKRVLRFDAMVGKTIAEIEQRPDGVRLVFADGTFADIDAEADLPSCRIVLQKGKPSRYEVRRWREERG